MKKKKKYKGFLSMSHTKIKTQTASIYSYFWLDAPLALYIVCISQSQKYTKTHKRAIYLLSHSESFISVSS